MKIFWNPIDITMLQRYSDGVPSELYNNPENWEMAICDFPYIHFRVRVKSLWNRFIQNDGMELKYRKGSECSHKIKGNCNTYHTLRNRKLTYDNIQTNTEKK